MSIVSLGTTMCAMWKRVQYLILKEEIAIEPYLLIVVAGEEVACMIKQLPCAWIHAVHVTFTRIPLAHRFLTEGFRTKIMSRVLYSLCVLVALFLRFRGAVSHYCSLDPAGDATTNDVLVLGGGMAAARTLEVNGIEDFVVLEATGRIGGRIRRDPATGLEMGANWIQGLDPYDRQHHPMWREWVRCNSDGPRGSATPYVTAAFAGTDLRSTSPTTRRPGRGL